MQQSSSCSQVSFLTNPKGQPSCFLLLLYESSLASASIFIRQFDVCSHHSAGPASRGGRAEGADVTRMRAGPGRAALAGRRRPPELCAFAARPPAPPPPSCPPPSPGLRCRPRSLSHGSQGGSPPPGRPAPRPRHRGPDTGARGRGRAALALGAGRAGERRAGLSAGRGRARGKVQPPGDAARPGAAGTFGRVSRPG